MCTKKESPHPSLAAQLPSPGKSRWWLWVLLPELFCLHISQPLQKSVWKVLALNTHEAHPSRLVLTLYSARASLTFPGYRLQHLPCRLTPSFPSPA